MQISGGRWAARRAHAGQVNDQLAGDDSLSRLDVADRAAHAAFGLRGPELPRQRTGPREARTHSDTVAAMLVAFSVAPSGLGERGSADPLASVSAAVAEAVRVVRESGLPNSTDAMFTTVEGDWDECMEVVKKACEVVGRFGSRVSLVLKADIRPGWSGQLTAKVERVEDQLRSDAGQGSNTEVE